MAREELTVAAQHVCTQASRLTELEKRVFPDSVEPFKFFMEDALFKQNMSKTMESLANSVRANATDISNLRERSDTKDDAAKEEARADLAQHVEKCPMVARVEAIETARATFYEKEFAPLRDDNLKKSWLHELGKPVLVAAVTYAVIEVVKKLVGA